MSCVLSYHNTIWYCTLGSRSRPLLLHHIIRNWTTILTIHTRWYIRPNKSSQTSNNQNQTTKSQTDNNNSNLSTIQKFITCTVNPRHQYTLSIPFLASVAKGNTIWWHGVWGQPESSKETVYIPSNQWSRHKTRCPYEAPVRPHPSIRLNLIISDRWVLHPLLNNNPARCQPLPSRLV